MAKYTREKLLESVRELLAAVKANPRGRCKSFKDVEGSVDRVEQRNFDISLNVVVNELERLFTEAGLKEEYGRLNERYNNDNEKRGIFNNFRLEPYRYSKDDTPLVEHLNYRISNFEQDLIEMINRNISVDEQYDASIMNEFIEEYLLGIALLGEFSYSEYIDSIDIDQLKPLYDFYGVPLTEEAKKTIVKLQNEEYNDFINRKEQGMSIGNVYFIDVLPDYICSDIQSKLKAENRLINEGKVVRKATNMTYEKPDNKELMPAPAKSIIPVEEKPKKLEEKVEESNAYASTINDKIAQIKETIKLYEEICNREAKLMAELEEIRAKKEEVEKSISGIKL